MQFCSLLKNNYSIKCWISLVVHMRSNVIVKESYNHTRKHTSNPLILQFKAHFQRIHKQHKLLCFTFPTRTYISHNHPIILFSLHYLSYFSCLLSAGENVIELYNQRPLITMILAVLVTFYINPKTIQIKCVTGK